MDNTTAGSIYHRTLLRLLFPVCMQKKLLMTLGTTLVQRTHRFKIQVHITLHSDGHDKTEQIAAADSAFTIDIPWTSAKCDSENVTFFYSYQA